MNDNNYTPRDYLHIMPIDDIKPHYDSPDCTCQPRRELIENTVIYIHNSWDGREILEQAIHYLNSSNN